ncbi:unnamed protein product [Ixodes pacificus]
MARVVGTVQTPQFGLHPTNSPTFCSSLASAIHPHLALTSRDCSGVHVQTFYSARIWFLRTAHTWCGKRRIIDCLSVYGNPPSLHLGSLVGLPEFCRQTSHLMNLNTCPIASVSDFVQESDEGKTWNNTPYVVTSILVNNKTKLWLLYPFVSDLQSVVSPD